MEHKGLRNLANFVKDFKNETTKKLQEEIVVLHNAVKLCEKNEDNDLSKMKDTNKKTIINIDSEKKCEHKEQKLGECKCNAECQDTTKKKKIRRCMKPEYTCRTICLCNIPQDVKKETVRRLCMKYGTVEAVTLKAAPVYDPCLPQTFTSYVRYTDRNDAHRALVLNGRLCKNNHLRVIMANDVNKISTGCTIFVGHIPYGAQEKDVWELFEHTGTVVSVYLKRDEEDGTCKGYGYVTFRNPASAELSLIRKPPYLFNKKLRILRCNAKEIQEYKKSIEEKDKEKKSKLDESDESIKGNKKKKRTFFHRRKRKNKRKKLLKKRKRIMKRYTIMPLV